MRFLTIVFSFILIFDAFAQVDTIFTQLRGIEDSLGNTNLYYRKHYEIVDSFYGEWDNSVYHYNLSNNVDSLFLWDHNVDYIGYSGGEYIADYEFWDNNPYRFIYGGAHVANFDTSPFLSRFDRVDILPWHYTLLGPEVENVEISFQNDSLIYAVIFDYLLKSEDGGFSWSYDSLAANHYTLIKLNPFDDQTLFGHGGYPLTTGLYKSMDGGINYQLVDSSQTWYSYQSKIFFDSDSLHLYAVNYDYPPGYNLLVSSDAGESWNILYTDTAVLNLAIDNQLSGLLYLSIGSQVKVSSDYGASFSDFATLNRPVIGMYKKPGIDLLYAATEKDIYEIFPGSITSIKSLPVAIEPGTQPVPEGFVLYQNYPNPFNSSTTIEFYLTQTAEIEVAIYNLLGQKVRTLLQGRKQAGLYRLQWDGLDEMGREVASGVYICRMQSRDFVQSRKMLFLK